MFEELKEAKEFKQLMRKTQKELQILALEKGYAFAKNEHWPKQDYALAILGTYPFFWQEGFDPIFMSEEEKQEALKNVRPKPKIKPIEVATFLIQVQKGKNAGKYMLETMHGARYTMKRFANIPIYIVNCDFYQQRHSWPVFNTHKDAKEWADKFNEQVQEMILTEDQIA